MRNWIACSSFLILFLSLSIFLLSVPLQGASQSVKGRFNNKSGVQPLLQNIDLSPHFQLQDTTRTDPNPNLPDPKSVMYKSMILPGWGQIINNQAWKVPIIYAVLGGLGYYSVYLTKRYHDYRAAYYNINDQTPDDLRFGPTPSYIPDNANLQQLKSLRNTYHNRRDLIYVGIAVAYGLNIVDAYVFAHMRSFDVSENLSMRPRIQPGLTAQATPSVTLSIDLITK